MHMKRKFLCANCKEAIRKRNLERSKERQVDLIKIRKENTEVYIKRYLDPSNSWKKGVKTYQKINDLKELYINQKEVEEYIKDMDYYDFLETPYWKAIAEYIRKRADYKCQLCNSTENLNVHHRTYEHHGDELNNLRDLICICEDCHYKFHDYQ